MRGENLESVLLNGLGNAGLPSGLEKARRAYHANNHNVSRIQADYDTLSNLTAFWKFCMAFALFSSSAALSVSFI